MNCKIFYIFVVLIFDATFNNNKLKATPSEVYHLFRCRNISTRMDGCLFNDMTKVKHTIEALSGKKFNWLTILREGSVTVGKKRTLICLCECGSEKEVLLNRVLFNHTKSCGCRLSKVTKERNSTHGMSLTPEYKSWGKMISRCYCVTDKSYNDYGGRGITVCDEWRYSFENFFKDMGKRTSLKHSIDRLNNELGYYKENCAWSTQKEQCNNRRSNHMITYQGRTQNMTQWCEELNIPYDILRNRLDKLNWDLDKAFTTNKNPLHRKIINTENGNIYNTIKEAAVANGIKRTTLNGYLRGYFTNKSTLKYLDEEV